MEAASEHPIARALVEAAYASSDVVRVLPEQNLVLVRGAVPGANGSLVMIRKSVKLTKAQQQKVTDKK